jgi:hypothetical protein
MTGDPPGLGPDDLFRRCPYCAAPIRAEASKCSHCGQWVRKPVGFLLGLAIFVAPGLFAIAEHCR